MGTRTRQAGDGGSDASRGLSAAAALRSARTVPVAMALSVGAFWVVAWFLAVDATGPMAPYALDPRRAMTLWTLVATAGFAGALVFRGRAIRDGARVREAGASERGAAAQVMTPLVIAWGLLEGPALLAGLMLLYLGTTGVLLYAAPIYAVGMVLTFPRAEWFGVDARTLR